MATPEVLTSPDLDSISCAIEIGAPPERVFKALTDESQLPRWFAGDESCPVKFWQMDARLGGQYRYETKAGTLSINGVSEFKCHGEIVEFDPPRVLAYTWIANWHDYKSLKTLIRYELITQGSGTHVTVTHSKLASEEVARKDYSGGWPGVLMSLKKFAEAI